jgi:uncharacterized protein (TIGR02646 family)
VTPVTRPPEPAFLAARRERWSESFMQRRAKDPRCEFDWHDLDGVPVNQLLMGPLRRMTAGHCAYCDHFELGEGSRETIDHFRPKSAFPELAYAWDNLFPACDQCQQVKGEDLIAALGLNSPTRASARRRWFRSHFAPSRWGKGRAVHALPYRFLAPSVLPP